jgi:23S rRNA U2552 (ribose-2'-O)-methylase RlmE/FtsJ
MNTTLWNRSQDTDITDLVLIPPDTSRQKTDLLRAKNKIDPVYVGWNDIKPRIHDYEFVYVSSNPRNNIADRIPVSRSYFKLKEMVQACQIPYTRDMVSVCLAEAPGGFIQFLREENMEQVHGITLVSDDERVPYWNRLLLRDPMITFHTGHAKDGDLYNLRNILSFVRDIGAGTVDLVTGDGGFDASNDYDHQEANSYKLIYSEVFLALLLQKIGGSFICKIFDTFEPPTLAILDVLRQCYSHVSLYKPCISRNSNSEKYVVCKGFQGYSTDLMNTLTRHFEDTHIPLQAHRTFLQRVITYTATYTEQQIHSIEKGLEMVREGTELKHIKQKGPYRLMGPTRHQVVLAKQWCQTYNVPINWRCHYL